jgi:flavin-dependent dehydrogenase
MTAYDIRLDGLTLHGHPIPLYLGRQRIATRRTLLVGDAAGLVDPFNGEGIRFAIKSGKLAAEAILAGRPEGYERLVWRQIGARHRLALGLAVLFYQFPRLCFSLGVRNPFVTYAFADLMAERSGYARLFLQMFGTLPVFLATETLAALAGRIAGPPAARRIRAAVYPGVPSPSL